MDGQTPRSVMEDQSSPVLEVTENENQSLDELPDLVLDNTLSFLGWPFVITIQLVSKRMNHQVSNHELFLAVFKEETAALRLHDPAHFSRTRAALPITAKSTIALAFSSDGMTLASTHGDHTVKLVDVAVSTRSETQPAEGCVVAELSGHPRTPWTVKFHPSNPNLVASGCLGGELRLWDAKRQVAVRTARLPHPVISLSFHPDGERLAAAAGTMLYMWDFTQDLPPQVILQTKVSLRCVRFLDRGRLLVGVRSRSNTGAGVTTYIRAARAQLLLYAFHERKVVEGGQMLSDPVVVVRRALLYNDAGLDVTQDNATVLTCAEFWLRPPGRVDPSTGEALPALAPLGPRGYVGGGDVENGEALADKEDALNERQGGERVAHLIQVSLALNPIGWAPPRDGQDGPPTKLLDHHRLYPSSPSSSLFPTPPPSSASYSTPPPPVGCGGSGGGSARPNGSNTALAMAAMMQLDLPSSVPAREPETTPPPLLTSTLVQQHPPSSSSGGGGATSLKVPAPFTASGSSGGDSLLTGGVTPGLGSFGTGAGKNPFAGWEVRALEPEVTPVPPTSSREGVTAGGDDSGFGMDGLGWDDDDGDDAAAYVVKPPAPPPPQTAGQLISCASLDGLWAGAQSGTNSTALAATTTEAAAAAVRNQHRVTSSNTTAGTGTTTPIAAAAGVGGGAAAAEAAAAAAAGGTFVTSVKLSPTGEYVLLGCSRGNTDARPTYVAPPPQPSPPPPAVGESNATNGGTRERGGKEEVASVAPVAVPWAHPVAAVWRLGDMQRRATLTSRTAASEEDDANVALYHPCPGAGVVYGTKQGQIACALSPSVLAAAAAAAAATASAAI